MTDELKNINIENFDFEWFFGLKNGIFPILEEDSLNSRDMQWIEEQQDATYNHGTHHFEATQKLTKICREHHQDVVEFQERLIKYLSEIISFYRAIVVALDIRGTALKRYIEECRETGGPVHHEALRALCQRTGKPPLKRVR